MIKLSNFLTVIHNFLFLYMIFAYNYITMTVDTDLTSEEVLEQQNNKYQYEFWLVFGMVNLGITAFCKNLIELAKQKSSDEIHSIVVFPFAPASITVWIIYTTFVTLI